MDIQFNPQDKEFNTSSYEPMRKSSRMVGWVMKLSRGKIDETQANYVLLGIAGVFVILTVMVIMGIGQKPGAGPTYLEDLPQEVIDTLSPEELQMIPSRNK